MTNTLTTDQLQELLQIQKEFDDRIPTLNLGDSKIAYVVEFFEWFNTLETFKNWKKKPGKPLDVQLDELADMLAFGLSIANQQEVTNEKLEYGLSTLRKDGYLYNESQSVWDFMSDVSNVGLEPLSAVIIPLDIAYNLYS
ncbi:TPA: dUTPase, partial [Staphylococcus aureus]|nr:dUTPase [Staphylococcus aureus]HDK7719066.1 dUTPase [Staphylococcus aureus]HDK7737892.1 dUTPase [Staphylococcus aureus]HDK8224439.1 dUTPase [Staphylococcus aureus]HEH8185815.1 dUTPase [Staphylococcus aureus]